MCGVLFSLKIYTTANIDPLQPLHHSQIMWLYLPHALQLHHPLTPKQLQKEHFYLTGFFVYVFFSHFFLD